MNVVSKCRHDEICSCIPSQALVELRLEFEPILETKKFLEATIAKLTHEFQKQSELNVRAKARLAKLQVDISESVDDRQTEQARLIPVVKLVFEHNKLFFSRLEKKGSLSDLSCLFEIRTLEGMWELYKPVIDVPEIPNRKNDVEEEFVFLQDDPQDGVHDMREAGVLLEYLTQANMVLQGKFAQKKISLTNGTHCVHMMPCHCIDLSKFAEEIKAVYQTKRKTIPHPQGACSQAAKNESTPLRGSTACKRTCRALDHLLSPNQSRVYFPHQKIKT